MMQRLRTASRSFRDFLHDIGLHFSAFCDTSTCIAIGMSAIVVFTIVIHLIILFDIKSNCFVKL